MANLADLTVGIGVDDELSGGLNEAGQKVDSFADKVSKQSEKLTKLGSGMQDAGKKMSLFATLPIAAGFAKMTGSAETLNESVNAVNQVFGDAAGAIHEFGETSASSVGLSASAFNELATPVGAMLQNVGFGADEAAEATIDLSKRAADMASVFNTDVEDAMGAIQAGLRGQADPLEQFGVGLSAVAVEAHALSMGLAETTVDTAKLETAQINVEKATAAAAKAAKEHGKDSLEAREARTKLTQAEGALESALEGQTAELTDAQKAQARLSLLMEQTERVAGDFASTSGESANAQRIATARAEDLAATFGQKLIPVKTKVLEIANSVLDRFDAMSPTMQTAAMAVAGVVAAAGPLVYITGTLVRSVGALGKAFTAAATAGPKILSVASATVTGAQSAVMALGRWVAAGATWVAQTVAQGARAVASMAVTAGKFIAHYTRMAAASLAQAARMAASWVIAMGPVGWVTAAVVALVALIVANWDTVVDATKKAWTWVSDKVADVWKWIQDTTRSAVDAVVGFFTGLRDKVVNTVTNLRDKVVGFFTNLKDRAIAIVTTFATAYVGFWLGVKDKVVGFVSELKDRVLGFFTDLKDRAIEIVSTIVSRNIAFWGGLVSDVIGFVTDLRDRAVAIFTGLKDRVVDTIGSLMDRVRGIKDDVLGFFTGAKDWLVDAGKNIIQGLIDGIKNMIGNLGSAVSGAVSAVTDRLPWSPAKKGPLRAKPPEKGGANIVALMAKGMGSEVGTLAAMADRAASAALPGVSTPGLPRVGGVQGVDRAGSDPSLALLARIAQAVESGQTDWDHVAKTIGRETAREQQLRARVR